MARKLNPQQSLARLSRFPYTSISVAGMSQIVFDLVCWYASGPRRSQGHQVAAELTAYLISVWVAQRCDTACAVADVNRILVLDQEMPHRSRAVWERDLRDLISKYKRSTK
jgi:hypothetical protein